jgi:carbon monoxide dehydrogenase subunit G
VGLTQLHLHGSVEIRANPARVFELLTDPRFLAGTLPDANDIVVVDESIVEARIKVKLSLVSSTLKVKLRISDRRAPAHAMLHAEGAGGGSSLKIDSSFDLEGDRLTSMKWAADAEITGLMAGLGSTLLQGFAEKKVREIFEGITKAIEAQA